MVNEKATYREKIVYSAHDQTSGIGDLVGGLNELVMRFMEVAHWATNRQIQIGLRGYYNRRYTTLERLLRRKSLRGKLRSGKYGKIKIYAKPMKSRGDLLDTARVYHGLSCTECLIRFLTAKEGEALPERLFRGYRRVPEFGIRFERNLLLLEFSTKHDTEYSQKLRGKLSGYDYSLSKIEDDFGAKAVVVFILDVTRERVKQLVEKYKPSEKYVFCDYKTFLEVPMGHALIEPVYIFNDGVERPLSR